MSGRPLPSVLITGGDGQLGQALRKLMPEAAAAGLRLLPVGRREFDITDADAVARGLDARPVAAVINAAAYTAVDRAEAEPETAERINAAGPRILAAACGERGIGLVQVSTDYVFDGGKGTPYGETHAPNPLGVYGRTKLAGEVAALTVPGAIVLRTGWVFSEFGNNFLRTMLRLGAEREVISVVADQIGGPTYAPAIARVLIRIVARQLQGPALPGGIYHFGGAPAVTWHDFAVAIFAAAREQAVLDRVPRVLPITTAQYAAAAPRPADARLDCTRLERALGALENDSLGNDSLGNDWRQGLAQALAALRCG